jgi:hypothetical protein
VIEFRKITMENIKLLANKGLPTVKAFSKAIEKAAESTCIEDNPTAKSDWFADAHTILLPLLIKAQNAASELLKELLSDQNVQAFRELHQALKKAATTAKNRSKYKKAIAIMQTMCFKPRKAWARMHNVQAVHNSHHKIHDQPGSQLFIEWHQGH